MKMTMLCSDPAHPVNACLQRWMAARVGRHEVSVVRPDKEEPGWKLVFLSSSEIASAQVRAQYASTVVQACGPRRGSGWSSHVWEILGGTTSLTDASLEAAERVGSGGVWKRVTVPAPFQGLWDEVNELPNKASGP